MRKLLLLGVALGTFANAGEILTNSPAWNGTDYAFSWGTEGQTPTYGETITVPTDGNDVLSSFTFYLQGSSPSINFSAYVQSWNGTTTMGTPVYTSSAASTPTAAGFDPATFSPNVALSPGSAYLLYFSTIGVANSSTNAIVWGATQSDTYSGGAFEYSNADYTNPSGGSIGDLNSASWDLNDFGDPYGAGYDLAFSATFTSTPEPASIGLVVTGLGAMLWRAKRRG